MRSGRFSLILVLLPDPLNLCHFVGIETEGLLL